MAFIAIYGAFAGGYNALLPTAIAEIYGENYDNVMGVLYFLRGVGTVVGPPIAGFILQTQKRPIDNGHNTQPGLPLRVDKFNDMILFTGALLAGASVCVSFVRWRDSKEKGIWRWQA